jgi:hypothetical protein
MNPVASATNTINESLLTAGILIWICRPVAVLAGIATLSSAHLL